MKKIPPGAEASNILVGEVGFLNHQIVAFVRLSKATILGDITEVPVPTRFVFILLGPMGNQNKFHEIGRSIATLMSDEVRIVMLLCGINHSDISLTVDWVLKTSYQSICGIPSEVCDVSKVLGGSGWVVNSLDFYLILLKTLGTISK